MGDITKASSAEDLWTELISWMESTGDMNNGSLGANDVRQTTPTPFSTHTSRSDSPYTISNIDAGQISLNNLQDNRTMIGSVQEKGRKRKREDENTSSQKDDVSEGEQQRVWTDSRSSGDSIDPPAHANRNKHEDQSTTTSLSELLLAYLTNLNSFESEKGECTSHFDIQTKTNGEEIEEKEAKTPENNSRRRAGSDVRDRRTALENRTWLEEFLYHKLAVRYFNAFDFMKENLGHVAVAFPRDEETKELLWHAVEKANRECLLQAEDFLDCFEEESGSGGLVPDIKKQLNECDKIIAKVSTKVFWRTIDEYMRNLEQIHEELEKDSCPTNRKYVLCRAAIAMVRSYCRHRGTKYAFELAAQAFEDIAAPGLSVTERLQIRKDGLKASCNPTEDIPKLVAIANAHTRGQPDGHFCLNYFRGVSDALECVTFKFRPLGLADAFPGRDPGQDRDPEKVDEEVTIETKSERT